MENKATEEHLASKSGKVWVHLREFTVIGKIRQNMKSMLQLLKEAGDEKTRELRIMPIFQSYEGSDSRKQFLDNMLAWGKVN